MSLARPFHRPRAILAGLAITVFVVVGYLTLQGLGFVPVAERSERIGPFEITYKKYDAYGHRGTGRTLHYHMATHRILVSRELGTFELNPQDPSKILFEQCSNGERPECGIHYFDGRRTRSWKVSNEQVIHQPVDQPFSWSSDGRFAVLTGEDYLQIVNLEKPATIDISELLGLSEGVRSVRFGTWSPDARKMTVIVSQYVDPVPPFVTVAQDLLVVHANTGTASYVATLQGRNWPELGYHWVQLADGYVVAAPSDGRGIGWKVSRKGIGDLPPGVVPQLP